MDRQPLTLVKECDGTIEVSECSTLSKILLITLSVKATANLLWGFDGRIESASQHWLVRGFWDSKSSESPRSLVLVCDARSLMTKLEGKSTRLLSHYLTSFRDSQPWPVQLVHRWEAGAGRENPLQTGRPPHVPFVQALTALGVIPVNLLTK